MAVDGDVGKRLKRRGKWKILKAVMDFEVVWWRCRLEKRIRGAFGKRQSIALDMSCPRRQHSAAQ